MKQTQHLKFTYTDNFPSYLREIVSRYSICIIDDILTVYKFRRFSWNSVRNVHMKDNLRKSMIIVALFILLLYPSIHVPYIRLTWKLLPYKYSKKLFYHSSSSVSVGVWCESVAISVVFPSLNFPSSVMMWLWHQKETREK